MHFLEGKTGFFDPEKVERRRKRLKWIGIILLGGLVVAGVIFGVSKLT